MSDEMGWRQERDDARHLGGDTTPTTADESDGVPFPGEARVSAQCPRCGDRLVTAEGGSKHCVNRDGRGWRCFYVEAAPPPTPHLDAWVKAQSPLAAERTVGELVPEALAEIDRDIAALEAKAKVRRQGALMRSAQELQMGFVRVSDKDTSHDVAHLVHAARASVGGPHFEHVRLLCEMRLEAMLKLVREAK